MLILQVRTRVVSLLVFTGMFGTFGVVNDVHALPSIPWFTKFLGKVMMLPNLYLGFPFFMVLCSGGPQGINTDLYRQQRRLMVPMDGKSLAVLLFLW